MLGTLGASLLEGEFLKSPSAGTYIYVGLIEEAVKLAALWLLARRLARYTVRDGIVLGAAVGFGFAALESTGYAFNALFTANRAAPAALALAAGDPCGSPRRQRCPSFQLAEMRQDAAVVVVVVVGYDHPLLAHRAPSLLGNRQDSRPVWQLAGMPGLQRSGSQDGRWPCRRAQADGRTLNA